MRKIILGAILLFTIMSCSEDSAKQDAVASEETSMKIGFNKNKFTGKDVKRGILPIEITYVEIRSNAVTNISGVSILPNNVEVLYPFNLVNNDVDGADNEFIIKNFQTGFVKFNALAITYDKGSMDFKIHNPAYNGSMDVRVENGTLTSVYNSYTSQKPRIYYSGEIIKETTLGNNSDLIFNLIPQSGRVISLFELSQELKDLGYKFSVRNDTFGMQVKTTLSAQIVASDLWGGYCTESLQDYATMNIVIYDENDNVAYAYSISPEIKNGEVNTYLYTLTSDNFPSSSKLQTTVVIPEIKNNTITKNL